MREFKISCHAISEIMSGTIGITDIQQARLNELQTRKQGAANGTAGVKALTPNMEKELTDLIYKRDHPQLPQGAKTFLKTWVKEKMFNRKQDWKSIVVDKGLAVEPMGIELIARVYNIEGLAKNDEFFSNDYMHGFPDLVHDMVRDVKSSWDLFTFPMFDEEMPNKDYWWQLQGYMELTGIKQASIDYVLIDTPMPLVQQDLRKLYYQSGGKAEEWTPDRYEELYPNYRFDDIPEYLRVKSFTVTYDPSVAAQIEQRVLMARDYIKTLLETKSLLAA